jgi:hypothetical protein
MKMANACEKTEGGERHYTFLCPSCGETGHMALAVGDTGQFTCPAECGACFIEYEGTTGWQIRCVVRPYFAQSESPTP